MENTVDDLTLQKDVSGYSSFFKTQVSLLNDNKEKGADNKEINASENENNTAKIDVSKNDHTDDCVKIHSGTETVDEMSKDNIEKVDDTVQNVSKFQAHSEKGGQLDDEFDSQLRSIAENTFNNLSEQSKAQSNEENDAKRNHQRNDSNVSDYTEENSIKNENVETIKQGNVPVSSGSKQQDDAVKSDHVQQARDSSENNQFSIQPIQLSEQVNMTRSTPVPLRMSTSDILETNDKNSSTEASRPSTYLQNDEVKNIQNKDDNEDQMPEIKQEEPNKTTSSEKKMVFESRIDTVSIIENFEETTDSSSIINQDVDESHGDNHLANGEKEEPVQESSEILIANNSKKQPDMQHLMYKSMETDEKDSTNQNANNPGSKSDKDPENVSRRDGLPEENIYFTGRLPSLLSRDETIQLTSAKTSERYEKSDNGTKEEGIVVTSKVSQDSDGRDKFGENESVNSPISNKSHGVITKEDAKPAGGKPLTPSRQIQDLLQEIKGTSSDVKENTQNRSKSNDNSKNQYDIASKPFPDAIMIVQEANEPTEASNYDGNSNTVNMTVDDINKVTSKVLGTNYAGEHCSRFDNIPHIKQIDDYVKQSKKTDNEPQTNILTNLDKSKEPDVSNYNTHEANTETKRITGELDLLPKMNNKTKKASVNTDNTTHNEMSYRSIETEKEIDESELLHTKNGQLPQRPHSKKLSDSGSNHSEIHVENQQVKRISTESQPQDSQIVKSSSTENDLKEIIASAKVAISTGTETTESQFGFGTTETSGFTLRGDGMSHLKRETATSHTTSKGIWSTTTQSDDHEALSSLICSNCLHVDTNIHLAGYCTNCQQYLCNACISVHNANSSTRNHEIVPSYCKNELAINKYVQATGYCADCSMFLCMKCVVQHTGFRANRRHRIIQSSFVSKSMDHRKKANAFLDTIQDKVDLNASEASLDTKKDRKKKRKLLSDLDNSNPYSSPFKHVPESLYPGPNKRVTSSYTKHPKWAHSSIPNLPYLVQPKPIPDRVFHAAGHHRPVMIYTKPKPGFDAMAAKFKSLKAKYKVKDSPKTARRREHALFTARPITSREGYSVHDMDSVKSHISGGRSIKPRIVQTTTAGKKEVEFINEHCLSIPFPRGEKRTDILAMSILMDGRLAILDKNNNNVKLFSKSFHCIAALQFQNRLIDICASNLCPTDVYTATPKNIYEVSALKGMDISRNIKVEIKRIEGMVIWKYGVAVISKKTNITWELRLLDYRGNLKSKLEVFNPFTLDIASSTLHHMTSSRGGKFISISDTKNSCIITVDVTTRVVMHETMLEDGKHPIYLASDGEGGHNIYVSCDNKVYQISKKGKVLGVLIDKAKENGEIGSIIFNKLNNRMYIKTGKDMISEYQVYF